MPEKNDFQYKPLSEEEFNDLFPREQMPWRKRAIQVLFSSTTPLAIAILAMSLVLLFSFVLGLRQNVKYQFPKRLDDYQKELQIREAELTKRMASIERQMEVLKVDRGSRGEKKAEILPEPTPAPTVESTPVPSVRKQRLYFCPEDNNPPCLRLLFPSKTSGDPFEFFFSVLMDNKAYYWFGMAQGGWWQFDFPEGVKASTVYLIHFTPELPGLVSMEAIPSQRENVKPQQTEKLSPLPFSSRNAVLQEYVTATNQKITTTFFQKDEKK